MDKTPVYAVTKWKKFISLVKEVHVLLQYIRNLQKIFLKILKFSSAGNSFSIFEKNCEISNYFQVPKWDNAGTILHTWANR